MRFRLLSVGAVIAVLVAGCGGSSTPTTTTKKQATKKAAATTTVSKPQSVTAAPPSTSTKSTASASSGTPTFASAGNCSSLSGVGEQFAKAMSSATSGGKFNLGAYVKAYQNLANSAPSAIRPDIQELSSAFSTYAADLAKANYKFGTVPTASQLSALETASKAFSASKIESASKAIEAWAVKNCNA
jgi:hypothetical protein